MNLSEGNKALWLWLLQHGGYWTVQEIAQRTGWGAPNIFRAVHGMKCRQLIEQVAPEPGKRHKRYGVSGTCLVPLGLTVAEVQA